MAATRAGASRRAVSAILITCFTVATAQTVGAQSQTSTQPASAVGASQTAAAGAADGAALAEVRPTRGRFATGLVAALFTGPFGPAIGYPLIRPDALTAETLKTLESKSPEYQRGFKTGWDKKTQARKRKAFLVGGAVGFLTLMVIFGAASER